jgi:hypothetical protein
VRVLFLWVRCSANRESRRQLHVETHCVADIFVVHMLVHVPVHFPAEAVRPSGTFWKSVRWQPCYPCEYGKRHSVVWPLRQTDAYSLCFNAAFMCRLQFAISYNFLQMTTMGVQTDFEKSVGKNMMLIPGINQYVPVIIGVFALLTLFDAFERTLRLFGIDQKGEPRKGNVEDEEKIEEGRSLVSRGASFVWWFCFCASDKLAIMIDESVVCMYRNQLVSAQLALVPVLALVPHHSALKKR